MHIKKEIPYTYDQLLTVVKELLPLCKTKKIITFTGGLGAGKTTFIRCLLGQWQVQESDITSPTFTYVNVYKNNEGMTFYHFDLYRIATKQDFLDAGFAEYLYQPHSVVLVEWPEPIIELLTHEVMHFTFDYGQEIDERTMTMLI